MNFHRQDAKLAEVNQESSFALGGWDDLALCLIERLARSFAGRERGNPADEAIEDRARPASIR